MSSHERRKYQRSPLLYLPFLHWFKEARDFVGFLTGNNWELEHLDPVSNGGLDDVHNLGIVPRWINQKKGNLILKGAELSAYMATEVKILDYTAKLGELYGWRFLGDAPLWAQRFQGFPQPPGTSLGLSLQNAMGGVAQVFQHVAQSLTLTVTQFFGSMSQSMASGVSAVGHVAAPVLTGLLHHGLPMLLHLVLL
ncbi:MAG: hypothetical protein JO126_05720 [Alphaproteobacteria bacterium]|nr:hypothetical protein [Alphaproteobacteria bacterium]MBV8548935.1 hypothetical protein [Alphaproteobacteria bacterium]